METKGQISQNDDKNQHLQGFYKNPVKDINYFIEDNKLFFISKKTEKLISAIYLITDLMSDREPIRWSLRKQSLELISSLLLSKEAIYLKQHANIKGFETVGFELSILLETAYYGGLISNMNFSILHKELMNLKELREDYLNHSKGGESGFSGQFNLEEGFFEVKMADKGQKDIKDNYSKETESVAMVADKGQIYINKGHLKDAQKINAESKVSNRKDLPNYAPNLKRKRKSLRQMAVIDLLKNKGSVSVKDISEGVKDCSEKTIQRELISMAKTGVLKKIGERRWSKYSLNL